MEGEKSLGCHDWVCGGDGGDCLGDRKMGQDRRGECADVGYGAEGAAGVGGLVGGGVDVQGLSGSDKEDEQHAQDRDQVSESLAVARTGCQARLHRLSGSRSCWSGEKL